MLDKFFSPQSVAIVGASHTPGKIGYSIVENFVREKFAGRIYPINPDTAPILNLPVFTSVKDVPGDIDLAVIVVPAAVVPKVLKECVGKKIKAVIIISAGFSETGEEGRKLEEKCKKIIADTATRVLGPNVIGVYDSTTHVDTLFLSLSKMGRPRPDSMAFISQSGAIGSTMLDWLAEESIGISKFVSYGNAMDINECDLLEYLGKDSKTKVIAVYLEGIKASGKRFIQTLRKITRRKPVVILKAGKTEKGTRAVVSHTGSLAGSAKIYSSAFKQTGAIEAETWEELFDYARSFATQPLPRGNRAAIVTDGGGFGVLTTDECERLGVELPEPSKALQKKFKKIFPPYVILRNPIDLTGDATTERYRVAIEECLRSREYDGVIAIVLYQVPTLDKNITGVLIELSKKYDKPLLCCASGGKSTRTITAVLETNRIPVYPTPDRVAKSFSVLSKYSEWLRKK